jgi:putative DNA primase/helicase
MMAGEIARALGRPKLYGAWWRCPCPVHQSQGDTLALRDGDRGLILCCHAGCAARDILAELRRRGLIDGRGEAGDYRPDTDVMRRRQEGEVADQRRRIALALDIWGTSYPASGTIVESYLRSRGITKPADDTADARRARPLRAAPLER